LKTATHNSQNDFHLEATLHIEVVKPPVVVEDGEMDNDKDLVQVDLPDEFIEIEASLNAPHLCEVELTVGKEEYQIPSDLSELDEENDGTIFGNVNIPFNNNPVARSRAVPLVERNKKNLSKEELMKTVRMPTLILSQNHFYPKYVIGKVRIMVGA
jgi:hypothetical protein